MLNRRRALKLGLAATPAPFSWGCASAVSRPEPAAPEVRGTWLTTTANDALATPAHTARTMQRLREIGLNTVYIESWKNGYTQYPSQVLKRVIGVEQRPAGTAPSDPSDSAERRAAPARDLLFEAVTEAHRQGLIAIAWFEYGFMAAHASTMPLLRRLRPEWLSRDRDGREVAPNGFVWMNPLHPEARVFLLDLVLEAIDRYDLDGIQLDDRIVWPYVTMGYDAYTREVYAAEHRGASPPDDARDPAWMRWRAGKVDEYARWFVQEVRARRPGLVISLSPAVYPWSWEHYLLNWPRWAAWGEADRLRVAPVRGEAARGVVPRWDEFVPQAYRFDYAAFERTWLEQTAAVRAAGADRANDLLAGIRIDGGSEPSGWEQLRRSIELPRTLGQGGHVLWFSRGVLDLHAEALQRFYASTGAARSPRFAAEWRPAPVALHRDDSGTWRVPSSTPTGRYRVIRHDGQRWLDAGTAERQRDGAPPRLPLPAGTQRAELLRERRVEMSSRCGEWRRC